MDRSTCMDIHAMVCIVMKIAAEQHCACRIDDAIRRTIFHFTRIKFQIYEPIINVPIAIDCVGECAENAINKLNVIDDRIVVVEAIRWRPSSVDKDEVLE